MTLRRMSVVVVVVFMAGPSMTWAGPGRPVGLDAPVSTMAPVVTRPFGPASIARAIAAEIAAQTQGDAQAPTQKKRDRVWNGVLIGAGVGATVGAISAATEDECHENCYGLSGTPPGYIAVLGSALLGAGVGALVDFLIK